ncbi:MAG TPA: ribosome small subunit-dependent GTPase A [Rhodocyclaceae bacterium]|nr:ribosome small subunit-dependent GTPase A [Rhodocyclaceae bacterium]
MSKHQEGTIVAAFGRHYEIVLPDGNRITGFPRGKKSPYACGDRVALEMASTNAGEDQAQIVKHLPRTSFLYRSDAFREKLIAANATQIVLVVATEPSFSDDLLARTLVAAEHEGLRTLFVLNKADLTAQLAIAHQRLAMYAALGYRVIELSAKQDVGALHSLLAGETSVLVGQSGMGKSTLTNALIPEAKAATREISEALDSGKHTTTHARLYDLPHAAASGGKLIDCPGLQEFGLAHLSFGEIEEGFIDFRPHSGHCRFRDCRHQNEPDCAIKAAVESGDIDPRRYEQFQRIVNAQC